MRLGGLSRREMLLMSTAAMVAVAAGFALYFKFRDPHSDQQTPSCSSTSGPDDFDEHTKSTDLQADIKLMWETAPSKGTEKVIASSDNAIRAASRVFNSVDLVGKTGLEVKALLGSPTKSNESVYRGDPFWPMKERGMTYRFDCGFYGWEFHVYVNGDNERVTEVARHWIH